MRSSREQVVSEPQPISRGSMLQGMPLRSTNRIPVTTARSGMRGRPARCPRPRRGRGQERLDMRPKRVIQQAWWRPARPYQFGRASTSAKLESFETHS